MANLKSLIKDAMAFAVYDITGRVLRDAALETMLDDFSREIGIPDLDVLTDYQKGYFQGLSDGMGKAKTESDELQQ